MPIAVGIFRCTHAVMHGVVFGKLSRGSKNVFFLYADEFQNAGFDPLSPFRFTPKDQRRNAQGRRFLLNSAEAVSRRFKGSVRWIRAWPHSRG